MPGYNIDDYYILKDHIQDLIDSGKIKDPKNQPNIKTNPFPNYKNMPLLVTYTISSEFPKSFVKNSIQDILENDIEKLKKGRKRTTSNTGSRFVGLICDPSGDKMGPFPANM